MKTKLGAAAVTAGALMVTCLGLGQTARAGQIELLTDIGGASSLQGGYTMAQTNIQNIGNVDGGEFGVRATNFTGLVPPPMGAGMAGAQSLFQTFCLELSEPISAHDNRTQNVETNGPHFVYSWDISSAAKHGGQNIGPGAGTGEDPISAHTAYLYTQFWFGTLAGYNKTFGAGRIQSALDLQEAIWYFEDELNFGGAKPNVNILSAGAQSFISAANNAVNSGAWSGIGNVRVLNLFDGNAFAQDVLVLVPLPPAAWLGLGLMSAMGVVGLIRRRRQQALA